MSTDNPVHDDVVAAFAEHTPSPDVSRAVSVAVETRDHEAREKTPRMDQHEWEGFKNRSRRETIRDAIRSVDQSAAAKPAPAKSQTSDVQAGAPSHWGSDSRGRWGELPDWAKLEIHRAEAGHRQHSEDMERTIAPFRGSFKSHGLSDSQAIGALFGWEAKFRSNPVQAAIECCQSYGVDLYQALQLQHSWRPQMEATFTQVSQGKPHFDRLRPVMGKLLAENESRYAPSGTVNWDQLYRDALGGSTPPTPPHSGAPAARGQKRGPSMRESINATIRELRGAA